MGGGDGGAFSNCRSGEGKRGQREWRWTDGLYECGSVASAGKIQGHLVCLLGRPVFAGEPPRPTVPSKMHGGGRMRARGGPGVIFFRSASHGGLARTNRIGGEQYLWSFRFGKFLRFKQAPASGRRPRKGMLRPSFSRFAGAPENDPPGLGGWLLRYPESIAWLGGAILVVLAADRPRCFSCWATGVLFS